MSTAFDQSRPRTFNLPQMPDVKDPAFETRNEVEPPQDQFNKRLTRYVYYPLDKIDPKRKNEIEYMAEGGDDPGSICMIRTRGFMPKGKITPLEIGYDWFAPDNMVDLEKVDVTAVPRPGVEHTPKALALVGVEHLPGPECSNLMGRWSNDGGLATGHTEIPQLLGLPWDGGEVQKLNRLFNPTGKAAFTLRELREDIERGAGQSVDGTVKDIANVMLNSVRRTELWANRHIGNANAWLARKAPQFTYTYSSVDELILAQLELPRQDRVVQNQANEQRELKDMMGILAQQAIQANQRPQMSQEDMMAFFAANQAQIFEQMGKMMSEKQDKPNGNPNQNRK